MFKTLLIHLLIIRLINCFQILKIGAIFDKPNEYKEKAFNLAINEINNRRSNYDYKIEAEVKHIPFDDPLNAMIATCNLIESGVVAILGPSSEDNSNMVQSICDEKEIPHLDVRWDDQPLTGTIINVYPYQNVLTQVYVDILKAWNYRDFVILYENNNSLQRVGKILNLYDNMDYKVIVRQLDRFKSGNYRATLKEIWRLGATHFLLDCSIDVLEEVLKQAQQVGLMTNKHNFIITNLDLHTIDLTPYQYSDTNITGLRFIDPEDEAIRNFAFEIYKSDDNSDMGFGFLAAWKLELDTTLVIDALMMFGDALKELPRNFLPPSVICTSQGSWTYGTTLVNFMKGLRYPGLTGLIEFDNTGYRSDFGLEVFELKEGGITKVANWTSRQGLNISRVYPINEFRDDDSLVNKTFIVIIAETPPHAMLKETSIQLYGNDRFEGFGIDLIQELSIMSGFNYTFILREDKANGKYNEKTGRWSGMIGDLIDGVADLAIADLTITAERESAVDFTTPFMQLGISILYQKAKKAPPSFFSFADPFGLDVWKMMIVVYFGGSFSLFILGRLCPDEWTNPYPCIEEPEYLVNQFTMRNCIWFITGSIMQQGSEIAPIAISTRMVAGMWWFFTLIMVSSYTANLAAFLTTENPDPHFTNVFELVQVADKKDIKYGAKANGATETFFREKSEQIKEYGQIYEYMKTNKDEVMVQDNKDGVVKAEQENYAFFMESTSIEYEIQRRCSLTQVGNMLDEKGYGIAMRKNSTSVRNILSTGILKLQENGKLAELKRKWWEERRGGGTCGGEEESSAAKPLNLKNVGGVFWVTIGGVLLTCILVFIEMITYTLKKSIKTKTPFKKALIEELKFYFQFSGMVKPVIYNTNSSGEGSKESVNNHLSYSDVNLNEKEFNN